LTISLFDAIILALLEMIANDYKTMSAESSSSRFATVSSEEAFMNTPIDNKPMGVLKWSKREKIDSKMHAYGDTTEWLVPVQGPKIDVDKIREALYKKFPVTSSFGALRWRAGWKVEKLGMINSVTAYPDGKVLVTETTGMAD